MRVTCVGDVGIDYYVDLSRGQPGGCTLNVAATLARRAPALDVHVVSAVGDDEGGARVLTALAGLPLTAHVPTRPGATAVQRLARDAGGERSFVGYAAGVLGDFRPDAAQERSLCESDWVATVVFTQIEALARSVLALPRRGRLSVDFMDLADFDRDLRAVEAYLGAADVGFFGLAAADPEDLAMIVQLRARARATGKTFVVTLGAGGSWCFSGAAEVRTPALPVARVVDTTGAGDAFAGAFLAGFLAGEALAGALAAAHAHAATVVGQLGAL